LKVKNKKYKLNWAFEKELRSDFIAGYCTILISPQTNMLSIRLSLKKLIMKETLNP
jgi:hypothetical protein